MNVTRIADRFLALTEISLPVEFDPKTLETVGVMDYADSLRGQVTTAHPHYDFARAEVLNYVTHFSLRSQYTVYRTAGELPCRPSPRCRWLNRPTCTASP